MRVGGGNGQGDAGARQRHRRAPRAGSARRARARVASAEGRPRRAAQRSCSSTTSSRVRGMRPRARRADRRRHRAGLVHRAAHRHRDRTRPRRWRSASRCAGVSTLAALLAGARRRPRADRRSPRRGLRAGREGPRWSRTPADVAARAAARDARASATAPSLPGAARGRRCGRAARRRPAPRAGRGRARAPWPPRLAPRGAAVPPPPRRGAAGRVIEIRPLQLDDAAMPSSAIERRSTRRRGRARCSRRADEADRAAATGRTTTTLLAYLIVARYVDAWHVMNLAVDPDTRRQGIGRGAARAPVRGHRARRSTRGYTLEVRVSNAEAIRLYDRSASVPPASAAATTPTTARTP